MTYASDTEIIKRFNAVQNGPYISLHSTELNNALEQRNRTQAATPAPTDIDTNLAGTSLSPTVLLAGLGAVALVVTKKKKKR